jgi:hypothetical protein
MASQAKQAPSDHQSLCERCGYILQGLPDNANCPECGKPVCESTHPDLRRPPLFEQHPGPWTFLLTSLQVLLRPSHFFAHFTTRTDHPAAFWFGLLWRAIASILLAMVARTHMVWIDSRTTQTLPPAISRYAIIAYAAFAVFAIPAVFLFLTGISWIAARLTTWEATYRGLRLPLLAVRRALRYHAVHLIPVALVALATAEGFATLGRGGFLTRQHDTAYLYTLCGEVILAAVYLFFTYWAAMRNILYANR